jgi:hypothetical protein
VRSGTPSPSSPAASTDVITHINATPTKRPLMIVNFLSQQSGDASSSIYTLTTRVQPHDKPAALQHNLLSQNALSRSGPRGGGFLFDAKRPWCVAASRTSVGLRPVARRMNLLNWCGSLKPVTSPTPVVRCHFPRKATVSPVGLPWGQRHCRFCAIPTVGASIPIGP